MWRANHALFYGTEEHDETLFLLPLREHLTICKKHGKSEDPLVITENIHECKVIHLAAALNYPCALSPLQRIPHTRDSETLLKLTYAYVRHSIDMCVTVHHDRQTRHSYFNWSTCALRSCMHHPSQPRLCPHPCAAASGVLLR